MMKKRIALFQGYPKIHFEMLGYMIEYCKDLGFEFDIFANSFMDWKEFYETNFEISKQWKTPDDFHPEKYDFIFLITDDDPFFSNIWITMCGPEKVICIDHMVAVTRREDVIKHIATRFSKMYPNEEFALPTYKVIDTAENKYDIVSKSDKIHVVCIGYNSMPRSSEELRKLFTNFDTITFHVIYHRILYIYDDSKNIFTYQDCPVNKMFDILKNADYVLALENNHEKDFINIVMSAMVPKSFNVLCPLIIPNSWKDAYNFKSSIGYDKTSDQTMLLEKPSLDLIKKVHAERTELINHRNRIFSEIILRS
jgi:hypothetical protein